MARRIGSEIIEENITALVINVKPSGKGGLDMSLTSGLANPKIVQRTPIYGTHQKVQGTGPHITLLPALRPGLALHTWARGSTAIIYPKLLLIDKWCV